MINGERKRLTSSERQSFMELVVARTALRSLESCAKWFGTIPKAKWRYGVARTLLTKLYNDCMEAMPEEQRASVQRNINGLKYSLHVVRVNGGNTPSEDGFYLSWKALESITEATRDRCLMCTKSIQEQRQCLLAKALDEAPVKKADNNARGCRYFGGLY